MDLLRALRESQWPTKHTMLCHSTFPSQISMECLLLLYGKGLFQFSLFTLVSHTVLGKHFKNHIGKCWFR